MKKLFTSLLFLAIICFSQKLKAQDPLTPNPGALNTVRLQNAESFKHANVTYNIIPSLNNSWGYNILVDNKLMIAQPTIPAISGNKGFENPADAEKVARLVVQKLKNGDMPPAVTIEELKKLSVIK